MEAFETFEHAGFVCELHTDEDPVSPADWDTLGTLYAFRTGRRDDPPGEAAPGDVQDAWERKRPGLVVRYLRAQGVAAVLCQFQDYGSSGARLLALDDDDDEIATGYIAGGLAKILADGPVDGDWRRALVGELETWDSFFQGEVVGYVVREDVKTSTGADVGEVVESCWGFYPERDDRGDGLEYVRQEARAAAEGERASRLERARLVASGWASARVGAVA